MNSKTCKKSKQLDPNDLAMHAREQNEQKFKCAICKKSDIVDKTVFINHIRGHIPGIKLSDEEIIDEYNYN